MKKHYFILGTGRSGTYSIFKLLQKFSNYEVYHEFWFEEILRLGTLKFHNKISSDEIKSELNEYKNLLNDSSKSSVVDISNALPLLFEELIQVFPEAKFIWVSRNGYKVVSSFFVKFQELMYPYEGMHKLNNYLEDRIIQEPNKEKTIWRPLYTNPNNKYSRFLNICYHWSFYEELAMENNTYFSEKVKFEELTSNPKSLEKFINGLDLQYTPEMSDLFKIPTNVQTPENIILESDLEEHFKSICGNIMNSLNYTEYYEVKY